MSTSILATKLYIPPPRPDLVARPGLLERLQQGIHRKLTLISAPAGFGKTTLVSTWIATAARPVAWLSLEEAEHDPNRFFAYLIAALQSVTPTIGRGLLEALHAPQPPPVDAILTALLNEIAALPTALLLVLDDYHLVDARVVDHAVTFLLEHLPPQLHLVITTREDPNLPLARLRARGQLTEIRAGDLRFTAAEAATFLNDRMNLQLTPDEIAALEARTEGWIAGLQLAALSMQGQHTDPHDRASFIQSFTGSHRFVMDYLVEEVLEQQPEHIQSFLLRTAILDRLCAPLCAAVVGKLEIGTQRRNGDDSPIPHSQSPVSTPQPQDILEALEQANLFLIPLDNERRWYRYHHLFADLLRQRLQQTVASTEDATDSVATYHRRAGVWFAENGFAFDALRHALAAADYARAAGLLEQIWRVMDESRRSATWLSWARQLPNDLIRARPVLSAAYGWALLDSGELEAADVYLTAAEQLARSEADTGEALSTLLVTDEAEFQTLPATIAAARTYQALALGDLPGTIQHARQTLALLPADNHLRRGVPAALLGLAYWTRGELALAHHTFTEAITSFQRAGNILFAITGAYILADIQRAQGHLHQAIESCRQALHAADGQGELVRRGTADLYTGLSELACEQGDLTTAAVHLQTSASLSEQAPLPRWRCRWSLAQASLKQAQGELDGALAMLAEAEQAYVRGPVPDVRPLEAQKVRIWIAQGQLTPAVTWAQQAGLAADDELSYLREFEHITLARLLIARYRREQTTAFIADGITLLTRLLAAAEAGERTGSVIEILMLQALAYGAQGEQSAAVATLQRALILAEPEGYVRLFANEGVAMARLLRAAAAHGANPDYTTKLLAAFGSPTPNAENPPAQPVSTSQPSAQPLIEPLSERELEVLQLVAQGLSNRAIAERLFIALSTVKGHNRVIYGKLQVQRRTEAVAVARELGLL